MSVRSWFWRRCWLGCGWWKSQMSPCKGIVYFCSLTSIVERKQAAYLSCSGMPASQSLWTRTTQECPASYVDEIGGRAAPLPMVNPSAFADHSASSSLFDAKKKWRRLKSPADFKPRRFDLWITKIQKRPFVECELALSKYCENSEDKWVKLARNVQREKS